ncbi:unnamed protein product [Onchocerca flexuosa]|uniref:Uncharacterized protein n=1 Tax=Onchocerca flexuosa TaxID=387005 RepID=A0A183H237_9BILA|nr:unnamed protein product [Onchocerca flexuosa]
MYAKIETKRLVFIRLNQTKLYSKENIHLRDTVDNTTKVGKLTVLSSLYAGSPSHMHEYTFKVQYHMFATTGVRPIHYIHMQFIL